MKKIILSLLLIILISGFVSSQEATETVGIEPIAEEPVKECIANGDKGSTFNDDSCCEGLKQVANSFSEGGMCLAPSDGSFICTKCGNGECGAGENTCNCPDDCEVETVCTEIYQPVCGSNGKTYSNSCYAKKAGVSVWCEKECPCEVEQKRCVDSDGGKDYYEKGYVEMLNDPSFGDNGRKYDICWSDGIHLSEYVCENGVYQGDHSYNCPNGCKDGACIETDDSKKVPSGYFAVDDKAPVSDVILLTDVTQSLKQEGYTDIPYGNLFSEVNAFWLNNMVTLAIYNKEAIIIVGANSPSDHVIFASLLTRILERKNVRTKTILSNEVKSSNLIDLFETIGIECPVVSVLCEEGTTPESYIDDNGCESWRCVPKEPIVIPECPVSCICDSRGNVIECKEDISHVYLDQKFQLKHGQRVMVRDHKNMRIKYIAEAACECIENQVCPPCEKEILLQVEMSQDCESITDPTRMCASEGTEFSIRVGDIKKVFGAEIRLMDLHRSVATLLVTKEKSPPKGMYVRLGEKFLLSEGDSAKVTDYSYMKIILHGLSDGVAKVTVDMPPQCEGTEACTGTATEFSLREGESREVFGARLTLLGIAMDMGAGKEHATFIVEKSTLEGGVDVEIIPEQQTISYGEKASYKVIVTDKHPPMRCSAGERCISEPLVYMIYIKNLPFQKDYPKEIKVPYGGSESFELLVSPYEIAETKESLVIRAITGKAVETVVSKPIKKMEISERATIEKIATSSASGGGEMVKEEIEEEVIKISPTINLIKRYKFSLTTTLRNNPKIQDTASAVLEIKPHEQPRPPEPPEFPGEKISIKLHKGWNLISLPGKLIKFDKQGLVGNQKLIGFVYIKEEQKYFSLKEAEEILGDELREYLAKNAFWIYSKNPMTLNIWVDRKVSFEDFVLVKGWNLVPITEDMLGGYLVDVLGDCDLEKINLWNAEAQRWDKIDLKHSFSEYQIGYGFLIKSRDYCKLVGPEIITPPPMPE